MFHSVTEIAEEGLYLSHFRGFLKVRKGNEERGRVPLNDVAVLMVTARGATMTKDLMVDLAEHDAITVLCDHHYQPAAMVIPYGQHSENAGRMRDQIKASEPLNKNLWKQLIQQKLKNQGRVLGFTGDISGQKYLTSLAKAVRSGDTDNREAIGAQYYWPRILGSDFRRSDESNFTNALLNYGYAVLRGASTRAVSAAGLLPAWGLGHTNRYNSFCLADDLMEPFRPVLDLQVMRLMHSGVNRLGPQEKRQLALILQIDMKTEKGRSPVAVALLNMAQSLSQSFAVKTPQLITVEVLANEDQ